MKYKQLIRRILRIAGVTALVLVVLAMVVIHLRQAHFRQQAERLHAEILALQLHPGTFADILRLQREWGEYRGYKGPCTEHHCIYDIEFENGWRKRPSDPSLFYSFPQLRWFFGVYPFFGGHAARVSANIRVRDNKMWGAEFSLLLGEYPGKGRNNGGFYENLVSISSGARLYRRDEFISIREIRRGFRTHEELWCLGCEYVFVNMAPQTNANDMERFNQIQFNCLTGWRSCKHPEDLAPALWTQAMEDEKVSASQGEENQDCQLPAQILAREADDIALVKVISFGMTQDSLHSEPYRTVTVRVLQPMKNGRVYRTSDTLEFSDNPNALSTEQAKERSPLVVGKEYFFLYRQPRPVKPMGGIMFYASALELRSCHALPNTPDVAARIQQGIALDSSTGEPYDYWNEPYTEQ